MTHSRIGRSRVARQGYDARESRRNDASLIAADMGETYRARTGQGKTDTSAMIRVLRMVAFGSHFADSHSAVGEPRLK